MGPTLRTALLLLGLLAAGCGGDERSAASPKATVTATATATAASTPAPTPEARGTRVTLRSSQFGRMLFDSRNQAIYVFERDRRDETVCYAECAEAWPPVLTQGEPVAGKGVDADLLGTVKRRGGARQLTYAGRPLYFYAHEGPGQVLCHNVDLNGGLWWVVGPDGQPRP